VKKKQMLIGKGLNERMSIDCSKEQQTNKQSLSSNPNRSSLGTIGDMLNVPVMNLGIEIKSQVFLLLQHFGSV
jgi:hypothetical protein